DNTPVATNDSFSVSKNTALTVSAPGVLSNDTDADNDPLTAVKASDTAHGTLNLNSNGSFTYVPATDFTGTDSFTYFANDGQLNSTNAATVTLTVSSSNHAPVAADDSYSAAVGTPLIVATPGVLSNDTDADNDPLTAIKTSDPAHGTVTLNGNGGFTYVPNGT